ncbi:uncharacterized protein LOC111638768 [Centruroides sculpturatus]|uniref:uncharacterized protein LOC111638768 n=1 Tax=Centruroides sculpturatus TaxID=218467 RepID=UPI000C6E4A29|nr:uncharacterized protein LOC111638768 [Centruroides sculpturatus]
MTFTSFALLSLLLAIASGGILEPDENCNRYGGICATRDSCPEVREENGKNLCPKHEKVGGVCCAQIPTDVTDCATHGGACFDDSERCHAILTRAVCPKGLKCCLLE